MILWDSAASLKIVFEGFEEYSAMLSCFWYLFSVFVVFGLILKIVYKIIDVFAFSNTCWTAKSNFPFIHFDMKYVYTK